MNTPTFTLLELNHLVRMTIEEGMEATYWVEAELSELHVRNHCYMELAENDAHSRTPVAKARAMCWANRWTVLRAKFERMAQQAPQAGMKVRLNVTPTFHEAYGFAYQVNDIDPAYTLGDIVRKRAEIIQQLKDMGIFDLQRELRLPSFAQRVAVVSSASAAGYGDFCQQLTHNPYGLAFSTTLFEATMQGERVEASVVDALNRIFYRADDFDVVVIIRGGGATTDMAGFDTLLLAENVANFPLPIITGIGHDRDECILDMVSFLRVKTPTAAAAYLVDHLMQVATQISTLKERIHLSTERCIAFERLRLVKASDRLPALFAALKERQQARLADARRRIDNAAQQRIERERHKLQLIAQRCSAQDPALLLQRGYSITLHNGHVLRHAADVRPGDIITTQLEQGTLKSEIKQ